MSTTGDDPYRIEALRKKAAAQYDLMKSGPGTAWEERGSSGVIPAFFKTAFGALFTPAGLFDRLRRPETTSDSAAFLWCCGLMWSLGALTNDVLSYLNDSKLAEQMPERWNFNASQFWMETVLRMVIYPFVAFVFLKIIVGVFMGLSAGELRSVPRTLVQNLFSYSLGPSLLAIIPPWYIGGPIAAVWILIDMIVAARKRLYMSASGSIINCILAWVCGVAAVAAGAALVWYLWTTLYGPSMLYTPPPPPHGHA